MSTILITGANKGLGYEAARRLVVAGHDVWAAARDPKLGHTAAEAIGARPLVLDVTAQASVEAARATVESVTGRSLDVLINNAGISGRAATPAADVTAEDFRDVYDVNVFGAVRVFHAFLPLLLASQSPVVVNVSSGLGSLANAGEWPMVIPAYASSKAALNMLTVQYAKAFSAMRINAVDPGYTATEFNGHRGTQSVAEGTDAIVSLASIARDGPTGTFVDRVGTVSW